MKTNRWFPVFAAAIVVASILPGPRIAQASYEARLETDYGNGLSRVVWKAAALSNGQSAGTAGRDAYLSGLREQYGMDFDAYADQAKADLSAEQQTQSGTPSFPPVFERLSAAWNEPTFLAFWQSGAFEPFGERSDYADDIYAASQPGGGLYKMLNATVPFLYTGLLLSTFLLMKKRKTEQLILPLAVFGGILFHLIRMSGANSALYCLPLLAPSYASNSPVWSGHRAVSRHAQKQEKSVGGSAR